MRKPTLWFPPWSKRNQAVQLQKIARGLKLQILKEEGFYYPCSENKGADQLWVTAKLICVFVFACANAGFSHDAAQLCGLTICVLEEKEKTISSENCHV